MARALSTQLSLADDDLFSDELTRDNFLHAALAMLLRNSARPGAHAALREAGMELQERVRERFRLDLSTEPGDEDDEFAPAIVLGDDAEPGAQRADSAAEEAASGVPDSGDVLMQPQHERMSWMLG